MDMRKRLRSEKDLELQMSEEFFDRLHDKIMEKVEHAEIAPAPMLMRERKLLRAHWRGWLYPTGGVASLMLALSIIVGQVSKVNEAMQRVGLLSDGHERIVAEAVASPDDVSQTLISSQSESDFFVDVASESFENLSIAKFNQLMGESERRTH